MQNWFHIFPKNTGLSLFAWIAFCVLPFYFIFRSNTMAEVIIGILMIMIFFTVYRVSFISKGWTVYVSVGIQIAINIGMTLYFGYVYFALFLTFFIGNIQNKAGFITLYIVHLVTTIAAVIAGFFIQSQIFYSQIPFILLSVLGVILIPVNLYNRNKQEELEGQLEDANKKISRLTVMEERERIARDLHDTLGQKLSLIGLKSDLAGKLIERNPELAKIEINDIHQTARTALKEVREMISNMKNARLKEEIIRVEQVVIAAQMEFHLKGDPDLMGTPLLVENVLSMCLKEAVTNVVKHSQATCCTIDVIQSPSKVLIKIVDDGIGLVEHSDFMEGHGIRGMKERLEFVNGSLLIDTANGGTTLCIQVPNVIQEGIS
ncbi:two-component system sensor histidine kinase DesK [Virgibacillus halotolerans]|uniref:sensor histidine kinase n=1 Tax=Virgibacillus halotolerans TaxID=1071053 RepID=UPI00195FFF47|nr:sensor histidine kinase [Virgibacillus halotolerans]MBM7600820.1 two-component system sensor histidine kinase DesK [Virgibacillus halotolerans]